VEAIFTIKINTRIKLKSVWKDLLGEKLVKWKKNARPATLMRVAERHIFIHDLRHHLLHINCNIEELGTSKIMAI